MPDCRSSTISILPIAGRGALAIPESEANKKMTIADPNELIEFPSDYLFKAFCAKDVVHSFRIAV